MLDDGKVTIATLRRRKIERQKIAVLTCYDCPTAALMASSGVDVLLVGDTYAEVVLGHDTTLPATMDMMIEVTRAYISTARTLEKLAELKTEAINDLAEVQA